MTSNGETPMVLARSEFARKRAEKKREQEEAEALERMKFRARECEVTKRKPFRPVLPHNFTVPDPVVLHSTVRAEERRKFDELLNEKTKEKMRLEEEERLQREEAEREELKAYRKRLEFKARPLPNGVIYDPYKVQPSDKELTVPATPIVLKRTHSK